MHGRLALASLLVVLLAGCQWLPYSTKEPGQAEDTAKKEEPADQAAQQKAQAERAARQKAQAARAAQQKAQTEREAQQKAQAEREAEQKAQAEREAQQCLGSVTSLRDIQLRWDDAERRANASPRLALPARLGEMRKLRQELAAAPGSPCSDKARADMATSTMLTESYLQNFLVNNREYLVAEQARALEGKGDKQTAKRLMEASKVELARLDACKGAC